MWDVHGLSSVLKRPIHSIYPKANLSYRPFYNKLIHPRAQVCQRLRQHVPLLFICTRTDLESTPLDMHWQPNHFVPCRLLVRKSSGHSMLIELPGMETPVRVQNYDVLLTDMCNIGNTTTTTSTTASPLMQNRLPSHSSSPLIQDKTDSHAPVQDRLPYHAGSPLTQD